MKMYTGSCHCGAIRFSFTGPDTIDRGLRCNCSICRRKGALMSSFAVTPEAIRIAVHELRHKIEPEPVRPKCLKTEPGVGYRLESPDE